MSTLILVAAVPHFASWCFRQLVHIECATVANRDIPRPLTATRGPTKTHFTLHGSVSHCGMGTIEPAWCMRTTMIFGHTLIRHLCSSISFKFIPLECKGSVAFVISNCLVSFGTVFVIQDLVVGTFCGKKRQYNYSYIFGQFFKSTDSSSM